ncbi:MAG: DNA methyltransferase [Actinomycetota bacterium]
MSRERESRTRAMPLPSVVSAPKNGVAYQVHSYPTKLPPGAIAPFLEACTSPGAMVLDPFCGSGMTGVAALSAGRSALLSDLSPGAVHLARNHTHRGDPTRLLAGLNGLDEEWMSQRERELYVETCPRCRALGLVRHTIWSDVITCRSCGEEIVLWDFADENGRVPRSLRCPSCSRWAPRAGVAPVRSEPVSLTVACGGGCRTLQTGPATAEARRRLLTPESWPVTAWHPSDPVDPHREMYRRSALHLHGVRNVADFYLPRARLALGELWARIHNVAPGAVREGLCFAFTNAAWHASRMRRYNTRGGQRPLTGTLYIPQLVAEANVFEIFRHQVHRIARYYRAFQSRGGCVAEVRRSSATDLSWIADRSIDYVFTDPPFGSNIFYADCNLIWESWLGATTDVAQEIVVNRSRAGAFGGKAVGDYERLLGQAFKEISRVLRPGGRASVAFHNSDDQVWSALIRAAQAGGLQQSEVSLVDKVQRSMKGYRGRSGRELVPFYDLVITFTAGRSRACHLNGAGEIAVEAVREHLAEADRRGLPIVCRERSLEYLYSLAVGGVVRQGGRPDGLSFRAFEMLCGGQFSCKERHYSLSPTATATA